MKLKKTWMGICVFVIYTVGIIFATGVTGFVSGLFPVYDKRMVTALIVAALAVIALVVSVVGVTIGKAVNKNYNGEIKWAPEIILPIILFVAAAFAYTGFIRGIIPVTGNMNLFESAFVTKNGVRPISGNVLDNLYVIGLNIFMSFLGNEIRTVLVYQLVLRMIMLIALYFALRNTIGIFGALAGSIATVAIPLFGFSIKHVYSGNLFFALMTLNLMLVVLYAKSINRAENIKPGYVIAGIIVGALTGLAVYVDLAAVLAVIFVFAALFSAEEAFSFKAALAGFIIYVISGLIAFGCAIFFIGGMRPFYVSFFEYANRFYGIANSAWFASASASWWNLVISLGMLGGAMAVIFGYIFSKRNERIVPWLLFTVLSCVISVVMGRTVINYDMYLFMMLAILTGCAVSCFAYSDKAAIAAEKNGTNAEDEVKTEDSSEEKADLKDKDIREVVMPEENKDMTETDQEENQDMAEAEENRTESSEEQKVNEETVRSEELETVESETEESEEVQEEPERTEKEEETESETEMEENPEPEPEETNEERAEVGSKKEESPRYVPEGMVLPTGDEDEEDIVPHFNMNRPEMQNIGILSVGKPEEKTDEKLEEKAEEKPKKDDFDISIDPDDDFDI